MTMLNKKIFEFLTETDRLSTVGKCLRHLTSNDCAEIIESFAYKRSPSHNELQYHFESGTLPPIHPDYNFISHLHFGGCNVMGCAVLDSDYDFMMYCAKKGHPDNACVYLHEWAWFDERFESFGEFDGELTNSESILANLLRHTQHNWAIDHLLGLKRHLPEQYILLLYGCAYMGKHTLLRHVIDKYSDTENGQFDANVYKRAMVLSMIGQSDVQWWLDTIDYEIPFDERTNKQKQRYWEHCKIQQELAVLLCETYHLLRRRGHKLQHFIQKPGTHILFEHLIPLMIDFVFPLRYGN